MAETERKESQQLPQQMQITRNRPLRWLYLTLGTISVGLGFLGIFVPLLPTTAFLLLAAWAYARSSDRFYFWLLNNRIFGKYISTYLQGKGMPMVSKVSTLLLLWITILSTTIFVVENLYIRILLLLIAVGVSIHIITLPTFKSGNSKKAKDVVGEKVAST